jgi:hypothetical protein
MTIATGGNDMPEGDIEVFHADEAWRIRTEAGGTTPSTYRTKDEAVTAARDLAQQYGVELIIRNQDGTIGQRDSHGHDPRDIPG